MQLELVRILGLSKYVYVSSQDCIFDEFSKNHDLIIVNRGICMNQNTYILTKREQQQFDELCSLVSGLSRSTDITLQLGAGWAWNADKRIVYVPKDDLMDLERCKAIAAHEVGHVLYTRHVKTQYEADDIYKPNISQNTPEQNKHSQKLQLNHSTNSEGIGRSIDRNMATIAFPNKRSISSALIHYLFNALEDPRIENGISMIYPGVHTWLWNLHHRENMDTDEMLTHMRREKMEADLQNSERSTPIDPKNIWDPIPTHFGPFSSMISLPLMFCHANIYEYHNQWHPTSFEEELPKLVCDALQATREVRKLICNMLPETETFWDYIKKTQSLSNDIDLCKLAFERVNPRLEGKNSTLRWSDKKEAGIYLATVFVWELIEEHILPWVEQMYQFDLRRLQYHIDKVSEVTIKRVLKRGDLILIVNNTFGLHISAKQHLPNQLQVESSLARQILDEFYHKKRRKSQEHQVATTSNSKKVKSDVKNQQNHQLQHAIGDAHSGEMQKLSLQYSQMKRNIAPYIVKLSEDLSDCLRPKKQFGWQSGYSSGTKIDLQRMLQAQARNRGELNFWNRRKKMDRRSAAATLLIDLSGSMRGEKSIAAIQGAILFVEALESLAIPISVKGFRKDVIDVIQFGEQITFSKRCDIARMLFQVGSVNNDFLAVKKSAEELIHMNVEDKLLIVISDGEPVGHDADILLQQEVKKASEKIHVVGLGLGPETEHVERYYPHGKGNIPVQRIGLEIALVLKNVFRTNRYH